MANDPIPQIIGLTYDPGSVSVGWAPLQMPGLSGFRAYLKQQGGATTSRDVGPGAYSAVFAVTLPAGAVYTVSVAALVNGQPGTESPALTVISVAPQVMSVVYDLTPQPGLSVRWAPVAGPTVTGYAAVLAETGGPVNTRITTGTDVVFAITLQASRTYQLSVRATSNAGIVQGPASAVLQPISKPPAVTALVYDLQPSALLSLSWGPTGDPAVTAYLALLLAPGISPQTRTPTGTTALFNGVLDATKAYQLLVRATARGGIVQGPASPSLAPILTPAMLDLIDYDGARTAFSWQAAADPAIKKHLATLATVGSSVRNQLTDGTSAVFAGVLPVAAVSSGYLRGADSTGTVLGPAASITQLITAASALTELDYDIGALTPSWSAVAQTPVSGYRIGVTDGTTPQFFDAGNTTSKTIAVTLDPLKSWSVSVRPTGQKLVGPPAPALVPLVQQSRLTNVYYNGSGFPFDWQAIAGVTGYQAQFYQDGVKTDDVAVTGTTATFAHAIVAGTVYGARVRATGDRVKGPYTSLAPGPFKMMVAIGADGFGRIKTVAVNARTTTTYAIDPAGNVTDRATAVTIP